MKFVKIQKIRIDTETIKTVGCKGVFIDLGKCIGDNRITYC